MGVLFHPSTVHPARAPHPKASRGLPRAANNFAVQALIAAAGEVELTLRQTVVPLARRRIGIIGWELERGQA
jgi:hypothetical protein